ncbi:MAG: DJ-1/PfpI family protein [Muribaculaceae bacterium]|nr:DJ-1/PfpI family protein [Muribaculaceae bacterium]
MKASYLFLANGFEEIEALGTVDVLRRANMELITVSISDSKEVTGAHGVTVKADRLISEGIGDAEWLILPGGMPGASNLAASEPLRKLLLEQNAKEGNIAAICASPAIVLAPLGIIDGRDATCYPGMEQMCPKAVMHDAPVVVSDHIVTGAGPAATIRFALAMVAISRNDQTAKSIGEGMLLYDKDIDFYF